MDYNHIQQNQWCSICAGNQPKILDDYKILALQKEGEYILNYIPQNVDIPIDGWKCKFFHTWKTSYHNIQGGTWCNICAGNLPKTLEDYKKLANEKGYEYVLNTIPEGTGIKAENGWKCEFEHIWSSNYNHIQQNRHCPYCMNKIPKNLKDYKDLAIKMSGEYVYDIIPPNANTHTDGWKCKNGHQWTNFYTDINQGHWCPKCLFKSEQICREIFEEITSKNFNKIRSLWLNGLELDGYCEELNMAFEYQGLQHDKYIPFFHRTDDAFEKQQERDKEKLKICQERKIHLILVPHTYTYKNRDKMKEYISNQLQSNN